MRPGQNSKRMRGRPGSRKGPNPLTRSYESSGPDVKIRGTAQHIGEKYLQLARDAQASGDPVMAESYLQHAEHYFRLIAAAQQAQQQGLGAYHGQPSEPNVEDSEEDFEVAGIPDRFASPLDRIAAAQASSLPQPQSGPVQPIPERAFHGNGDRQGFARPERPPRPERPFQERGFRDREHQAPAERSYQDQRSFPERRGRDQEGNSQRTQRDYRIEPPIRVDQRSEPQIADAGIETNTLPAFITAPVRAAAEPRDPATPMDGGPALRAGEPEGDVGVRGFHPRPRRRRRPTPEAEVAAVSGSAEADTSDPVQD